MAEGLTGLLRWYVEMGVDIAVDDAPHDRFAESRASICRAEMSSLPAAPPETIEISRRVMREERQTVLPQALVRKYENDAFWRDPARKPNNVRVV